MASAKQKTAPVAAAPAATDTANEASTPARAPVTARGDDLVRMIATAGGMYLTQEEGNDLVAGGFATVDTANTQGNTAFVQLTDTGLALINPASEKAGKPLIEIDDDVPMPEAPKKRGGKRGSKYPFDKLEVGKSFHVPKTKDIPNPVSALASSLTGARRRYETPVVDADGKPVTETVTVKTYAVDAGGKRIKQGGKFVVTGEKQVTKPKMLQQRDFTVAEAAPNDKRGPGARVFRTK